MLLPWKKFIYCLFQGLLRRSETCIQDFASVILSNLFLCINQNKYFSNFLIHSLNTQIPLRNDSCTFMTEKAIQIIIIFFFHFINHCHRRRAGRRKRIMEIYVPLCSVLSRFTSKDLCSLSFHTHVLHQLLNKYENKI